MCRYYVLIYYQAILFCYTLLGRKKTVNYTLILYLIKIIDITGIR